MIKAVATAIPTPTNRLLSHGLGLPFVGGDSQAQAQVVGAFVL